jgi:hypothetical protein
VEPREEVKHEESEAQMLQQQPSLRVAPNIIGNVEDMMGGQGSHAAAALAHVVAQPEKEKEADATMFVPVEPRRTTAQEQYRMQSRTKNK